MRAFATFFALVVGWLTPAATGGDDFSNSLFACAWLLPFFGEQFTKQFTMGCLDQIIFAMAPLGILTVIAAIRVGGLGTSTNDPLYQTMVRRLCVRPSFFRASVFAAGVPFVSAGDTGDDFSNNLFSDLAPILALFGEQVAKQYMSQSMSWVEDVIFACAPLGIITAIVGAIRVSGPTWMKAVIGRARESEGIAEVELMSSTSDDVCELWNGYGVIRVLGSSPIIELYYLEPDHTSAGTSDSDEIPLLEAAMLRREDCGIWDFKSAISRRLLEETVGSGSQNQEESPSHVPNIGLNLSGQRVSPLEFGLVAVIGLAVQLGVIAFAGVSVYLPTWNQRFGKGGKPPMEHAFPFMATGTTALVIGMFLCCSIIERRTTECTWAIKAPEGYRVRTAWLQKGGEVNDQHFQSYILHRAEKSPSRTRDTKSNRVMDLLHTNTRFLIRTSHKSRHGNQLLLTASATIISLGGFIAQFVGLRGLAWQVTIAQLVATGIMTGLRAMVRRNLVHQPEHLVIEGGYELEAMAKKISHCSHWNVTTWRSDTGGDPNPGRSSNEEPSAPTDTPNAHTDGDPTVDNSPPQGCTAGNDGSGLAQEVMDARRRLRALSGWTSQWQKTVDSVAEAIETTMGLLWTDPDVRLTRDIDTIKWKLFVETSADSENPESWRLKDDFVQLVVSRHISNGAWGPWKAVRNEIEAALGLWMLHLEILKLKSRSTPQNRVRDWRSDEQAMGISKTYRIVGSGHPPDETVNKKWLLPQTKLTNIGGANDAATVGTAVAATNEAIDATVGAIYVVGKPSNRSPCLAVLSEAPLERICGQHIFSTFLTHVVGQAVESIGGKVLVRAGDQGTKASFGLRNTVLDKLVSKVEQTGLATVEDALISIVPALGRKLSSISAATEAFSNLAKEVSTYIEGSQFEQAETLLLWLLDTAESEAKRHENDQNWHEACRTYSLLSKTYSEIKRSCYGYWAEKATNRFCDRLLISSQTPNSKDAFGKALSLVKEALGEDGAHGWDARLKECEEAADGRKKHAKMPTRDGLDGEGLCQAAACGNWFGVMQALQSGTDINFRDALRRTPLMLASVAGHATTIVQLLNEQADPLLKDCHDRTALHYAARRNDTSVLHALLLHNNISKVIDALDNKGLSPLQVAIQGNAGAAVALLVFYGANDPEGSAKMLLKSSIQLGPYAAIEAAQGLNSQDSKNRWTSLHWAVWRGPSAALQLLRLNNTAKDDIQAEDGSIALHLAASTGCDYTVRLLIENFSAKVNAETKDGSTALHLAAASGYDSTVELLIQEFGADKNARSGDESTALHLAAAAGHRSTVQMLVGELGVDKEAKAADGSTALHLAAAAGLGSVVQMLVGELGVDKEAKTADGSTALHLAASKGHDLTSQLLVRNFGVDKKIKNSYGKTALILLLTYMYIKEFPTAVISPIHC